MMKKYMKPLILILILIFLCAILSKVLNGSETLLEHARKHSPASETTEEAKSSASGEEESASEPKSSAAADKDKTASKPEITTSAEERATTESTEGSYDQTLLSFYYEPLSTEIIARIDGISYQENENITLEDLRYVHLLHYNFEGEVTEGELICNKAIAQDLLEIFYELFLAEYQIEKIQLIDEYEGDDTASMEANNTSCFNYRVVDGTSRLSKHAYGLAIDINPFYNPYVVYQNDGTTYISPAGSEAYADRSRNFPYKIDENDLCYKLFAEHGFTWGGNWNSSKDYQHFQKTVAD